MSGANIVRLFEKQRPVCVMAQMALDRLLSPDEVDRLFDEVADHQYTREVLFSSLAKLLAGVVLCRQKSVNSAYKKMQSQVGVSLTAVYQKLARVELGLSQALVRYSYARLRELGQLLPAAERSSIAGLRPWILDGNHLAATEHRLRETRDSTAAPLPGKALVVLDPRWEAIADLFPLEDGHAQERSALDQVLEIIKRGDLWIADRNFCTLKFMYVIAQRGARFVIRLHDKLHGQRLGERRLKGKTATGRVYETQLQLTEYEHDQRTIRCVEVELSKPTRDGDRTLTILTNLTAEEASAAQVAEVYRQRWRIETAFQKLTTTLHCEINTLCYPKAALFAFSLACLAYNAVALVLAALRAEHGKEKTAELSFHYLSLEIAEAYDGMMVAVPPAHWTKLRQLAPAAFVQRFRKLARSLDLAYYRKAKRQPKKPKPPPRHQRRKVHVSTSQLLQKRKQ
jgi:IS4 transposase